MMMVNVVFVVELAPLLVGVTVPVVELASEEVTVLNSVF